MLTVKSDSLQLENSRGLNGNEGHNQANTLSLISRGTIKWSQRAKEENDGKERVKREEEEEEEEEESFPKNLVPLQAF